MTKTAVIGLSLLVSNIGFGQTLEERIAALEEKVAKLETQKEGNQEKPTSTAEPAQAGVIFSDGFEKGISGWNFSTNIVLISKHSEADSQIAHKDNPRAAKEIKIQDILITPATGKRFLTFASEEKNLVVMNMKRSTLNSTAYQKWRGVHVLESKESFSLSEANLPVLNLTSHMLFPTMLKGTANGGHFEIGSVVKDAEESTYTLIQSFQEDTEGWKTIELDLSGLPKDKELRLVLRYFVCDARLGATPGVQIDDIKIFDDGL